MAVAYLPNTCETVTLRLASVRTGMIAETMRTAAAQRRRQGPGHRDIRKKIFRPTMDPWVSSELVGYLCDW